jgi:NADH-quinone oxidoreductase subunit E
MEAKLTPEESAILEELQQSIQGDGRQRNRLIPILQKVQERLGYLPPEAVKMVADHLAVPPSEVYSVATFYNQFRFHPPGKYPIRVCMGTACHVRGGEIILENFERKLGIGEGETSEDREFSIERVACVGCCALAPVALVGETVHGHMAPSKVEGLYTRIQVQKEIEEKRREKDGSE